MGKRIMISDPIVELPKSAQIYQDDSRLMVAGNAPALAA
jgi:hypothetical protein